LLLGAVCASLVASQAFAHEILSSIERGRGVAVKAYFADGEPVAYAEYQLFAPEDAKIPYQKGRTDRAGYVAFVPCSAGTWHLRLLEGTGHGLDMDVPVDLAAIGRAPSTTGLASWAFVLRPIVGVLVVSAIFYLLIRRSRGKRPEQ
jgi:nickel transport protein